MLFPCEFKIFYQRLCIFDLQYMSFFNNKCTYTIFVSRRYIILLKEYLSAAADISRGSPRQPRFATFSSRDARRSKYIN